MKDENEDLKNFDFIDEIRKEETYSLLFPDKIIGITIALLKAKVDQGYFENGLFTEKDIHSVISEIRPKKNLNSKTKHKWEHYDSHIRNLQYYFLDYDESLRKYSLKEYAIKFCQHAESTLRGNFKPTEIEKICQFLSKELGEIGDNEGKLIEWFEIKFNQYKSDLKEQVDFLDRQVDQSVSNLRKDTAGWQNNDVLLFLKTINEDLDEVKTKNLKLRSAYRETDRIANVLREFNTNNEKVNNHLNDFFIFLRDLNRRLTIVNSRLDRIQPKIKQLFATLNKPEYNYKIELFLKFLLNKSELKSKQITLPSEIALPFVDNDRVRLITLDRDRQLFPPKPQERKVYERDLDQEAQDKAELERSLSKYETVNGWVEFFIAQIKRDKQIKTPNLFIEVLEKENYELSMRVLFELIDRCYKMEEFHVITIKGELVKITNTELQIWNTTIQMK